jgi:uncharacterized protein YjbJ (UPF0337 family)
MSQVISQDQQSRVQRVDSPAGMSQASESTMMIQMIQRAAADPTVDVSKMERLMQMHERFVDRQSSAAFNSAMVRAQAEIGPVFRDKFNAQTNSAYAALESIDGKIAPVYTSHGFSLSFGTGDSPLAGHIRIVCDCMHDAGHTKQYHVDLPIDSMGIKGSVNKTGVHAAGSTYSYARRYLTMMIFNVVMTNEDNDGNNGAEEPIQEPMVTAAQAKQLQALLDKCSDKAKEAFGKLFGSTADVEKSNFDRVLGQLTKSAEKAGAQA